MKDCYSSLLSTPLGAQWKRIGTKRRAGIVVPLFFIWSKKSLGIGEIPDLKHLIDFCKKSGFSILQLLSINDTGFNSSPYSLQSGFAINSIYLSVKSLVGVNKNLLEEKRKKVLKEINKNNSRVNYYGVKNLKLMVFWEIFKKGADLNLIAFKKFKKRNSYWLDPYVFYRVLKEKFNEKKWEDWPEEFKKPKKKDLIDFSKENEKKIEFHKWLQWQLFEQLKKIKNYADKNNILLIGDFCWLMARDSADVWLNRKYFELSFDVGTPPETSDNQGQRWGFPPLSWQRVIKNNLAYTKGRLRYFENFYHISRIDHVLGIFRIWKISLKNGKGRFDPRNRAKWGDSGKKILLKMIKNTKMMLVAEDLGLIFPECLKILNELGILGIKVQRWFKNWKINRFVSPDDYPAFSMATISTHDTSNWATWWKEEASKSEREQILYLSGIKNKKISFKNLIEKNLKTINGSNSIFCILLLNEWLYLDNILKKKDSEYIFNRPGTISPDNWSSKLDIPVEILINHPVIKKIKKIIQETNRY